MLALAAGVVYGSLMRILCTNDDGVRAEGLSVLERIAHAFTDDVWTVAPLTEQSGTSRALTLAAPLRVHRLGERRFAVEGTPTDCVLLAVQRLITGGGPDLVLSGVNHGQNLAEDVTLSGTVAGAMEGMQLGIRSVAFSQAKNFRARGSLPLETAAHYGPGVLERLLGLGWPGDVLINVNFPDRDIGEVTDMEVTELGKRDHHIAYTEERTDLRGHTYYWIGFKGTLSDPPEGTDLRAVYDGRISVTPVHLGLTHADTRLALKGALGGAPPVRAA